MLAVIAIGFVACKKKNSYTCDCTYTSATSTVVITESNDIGEKSSVADAEADCNAHKSELVSSGAVNPNCQVNVK